MSQTADLVSRKVECPGRNSLFLVFAANVSPHGGLLFGYDNIVISGAIGYLAKALNLDAAGIRWTVGWALMGRLPEAKGFTLEEIGKK